MHRATSWWEDQSPRRQDLIRWIGPLLAIALIIGIDWLYRQHQGVATPLTGRALVRRVGLVCALAAVVMFLFTRRWPLQQLGLLALLFGVAGLFVRIIGQRGPQPVGEIERDLIQSLLDVGAVTVMVAVLLFALSRCDRWWQRVGFGLIAVAFGVLYAKT